MTLPNAILLSFGTELVEQRKVHEIKRFAHQHPILLTFGIERKQCFLSLLF